ncbi:NlpC/P60 family peptidoglycan endopeptidase RipB [Mycobacterium montefiorense]|uniref:Peptidoglycan endopeptidase RipB n=1 Tax=Mycobacterium montefiorense TaxID=154654 RepID=A0AA37PIR3_9MYCO|nr:NlpC/P60 family peptidoglycan endopeptidase RipB [Mycobacterium montefiorense]GBG38451.1 peptidoglycan endopeptidase RipB [Mycobacterium montefiorense]GKU34280.1 peptidoglycan endopeptidase RipB [Mycobacterium montefiorense]GKU38900.1 peptidoglycan endopeptidase RipB [Mycobacterium montefiorense]GKU48065.1 peptidoglycan endopeptidase RipB [Mycobacterium montefiorense]GKU49663.1 peptidoglycan endopeptidase RipB [Mycobacterium montefiorense]
MGHKRFRLINLAWITTVVTGLMLSVAAPATADPGGWDPTLPATISAGAPGDPLAVANASLQATAQATQTTLDLGKQFLGGLGINIGGDSAPTAATPTNPGGKIPRANGRQAIEYVIRRMGSQMGVPYSWGGGSLEGPSKGVGDGANINGFDCSGLMRYGFAGVGVLIPRFSGDQYNAGRHIPPNEARRGDLIFYGPGGGQHVTMYLGNGQMLEASGSAAKVTVSPVRKPGMTPYLTRIIEY